jgi:hypothetical protein
MISQEFAPLDKIKELVPAFCNGYGWLSLAELNLLDPYGERFQELDLITFEDGSIFVIVTPCSPCL